MVNVIGIHPDCEISGTHPIQKKPFESLSSPVVFLGIFQLVQVLRDFSLGLRRAL